jgi:archaellum component FlaC
MKIYKIAKLGRFIKSKWEPWAIKYKSNTNTPSDDKQFVDSIKVAQGMDFDEFTGMTKYKPSVDAINNILNVFSNDIKTLGRISDIKEKIERINELYKTTAEKLHNALIWGDKVAEQMV